VIALGIASIFNDEIEKFYQNISDIFLGKW